MEVHKTGAGNSNFPPLRDGADRDIAQPRDFRCPAERINNRIRFHSRKISALRIEMQPAKLLLS